MAQPRVINRFGVEELESRVLLSATLSGVAVAAATGSGLTGHQEVSQLPAAVESPSTHEAFAGMEQGQTVVSSASELVNTATNLASGNSVPPVAQNSPAPTPEASPLAQNLVTTLRIANAPPADIHALAIPDLNTAILTELALFQNGTLSGTQTLSLPEAMVGGVLDVQSPMVTFTGVQYQGNVLQSGLVSFSGSSATLFSNPSNGSINGSFAISTGSFDTHFQIGTLQASFSVTSGNALSLALDDSTDTGAQTGTLTGSSLTGFGLGASGITYGSLAALSLNLGSGNVTLTVNATSSPTTIYAGSGLDSFIVNARNPATGQPGLLASLTVNGQVNGFPGDTLTINGNSAGNNFVINGFSVLGAGAPISYQTLQALTVNGIAGPNSFQVDGTSIPTTLNGGSNANSFTVNDSVAPLTLNGGPGANAFLIQGNSGPLAAFGNGGSGTFTVNASSAKMTLTGGAAGNSYTVNANSAPLFVVGGGGGDVFKVNGTSSPVSLLGGSGASTFTLNAQLAAVVTVQGGTGPSSALIVNTLANNTVSISSASISASASPINFSGVTSVTVNGGAADTFVLSSDTVPTTINGGSGNDTFDVRGINASTTLNAGAGINTINVGSSAPFNLGTLALIASNLVINGGGVDLLNVDDTGATAPVTGTLTAVTALTGLGMGPAGVISYNGVAAINISMGSGGNTFTIAGTNAASTTLNTGFGNDTVNVWAIGGPTTINTGNGTNSVAVGNQAGQVSGILGLLTVNGNGTDTMSVNDTGTSQNRFGTLTGSTVTGLGMGPVDPSAVTYQVQYSNDLETWSILGVVNSSAAQVNWTDPQPNGPAGFYRVVEFLPAGDQLAINPTLSTVGGHIQLAWANGANGQTALAPGGIQYSGLSALSVSLGSGGDSFTIASTNPATVTTVNGGGGSGTINLAGNSSATNIVTQGTNSTVNIESTNAPVNITMGPGSNTINVQSTGAPLGIVAGTGINVVNVGSLEPLTSGIVDQIQGAITISGASKTTVNLDDSGNSSAKNGLLTSNSLSGLNMAGISYTGLSAFNLGLGSGGNNFTIGSTSASTVTNLNSGAGNDTVNAQAASGILNITTGPGANTVNVSSAAPATSGNLNGIQGLVSVTGSGNDTLNIDDAASAAARVGALGSASLTGLGMVAGINYTGVAALNISLGSGGNTFTISSTDLTTTTVNSGSASDTVNILSTAGLLNLNTQAGGDIINVLSTGALANINTGAGANVINVGSKAPLANGNLDGIHGPLNLTGNGADALNLDDTGASGAKSGTLTSSTLAGLGTSGITYAGVGLLNLNLGSQGNTFNIQSTSAPTNINSGSGLNTINVGSTAPVAGGNVNSIVNPLTLTGPGTDTLNIDDTGSAQAKTGTLTASAVSGLSSAVITYAGVASLNLSLGSGGNTFTIASTSALAITTLNSGSAADTVNILSTSGVANINTQAGNDILNIQGTGAAVHIDTGAGANITNVGSAAPVAGGNVNSILGAVTLAGNGADILNIDDTGSAAGKNGALSSVALTGLGTGGISYAGVASLTISLGTGADTFAITSSNAATTTTFNSGGGADTINVLATGGLTNINAQAGDDIVNIQSTSAVTNVDAGSGINIVNVGSKEPALGGVIDGIQGALTVLGSGANTLNIDDTGSAGIKNGTLSSTLLSGLGLGPSGITYSGIATLNVALGSGGNTFLVASTSNLTNLNSGSGNDTINIQSTAAPLNVTTGAGTNTVNVGSAPATVVVNGLQGLVTVAGNGADTLNVTDTGSTSPKSGNLTGSALTGLAMAGINYSGLANLNISLGSGSNSFAIASTNASTITTLNSGAGSDTVDILSASGRTNVNAQGGNDTINIKSIGAPAVIDTGTGTNIVNVGSGAPASVVDGIQGGLTIAGSGNDTLNIDDTANTTAKSGSLSANAMSDLGTAGISYTGLAALNISLGQGGNIFTVAATNPATTTTVNSGIASDTVNVLGSASLLNINTQAGDDTINIQRTGAVTNINTGTGTNTVNVGSAAPAVGGTVNGIQGVINLAGSGSDTLNVDDTGSALSKTGTLTNSAISGLGMAGINYSGLATLNISLGSVTNTFNIASTNALTATTVNSGSASDTVNVLATSGLTNVNTQGGDDVINVQGSGAALNINTGPGTNVVNLGSVAPLTGGNVNGVQGVVSVTGSGLDTLNVDDRGSAGGKSGTLTITALSGLGMATVNYSGLAALNINLGSGGNSFDLASTNAGTITTLKSGSGADTVNVLTTAGPVTINTESSNDTVNVQSTGASLQINTGAGTNIINVASTAGTLNGAGKVDGILGAITLAGSGSDILNIDDTRSAGSKTGSLTSAALTGLGTAGISYAGLATLNIALGSGGNTFNILSTNAVVNLKSGSGADTVNIQSTGVPANINTGSGINTVNVGSTVPVVGGNVNGIQGALTMTGSGADTLNMDDTGSTADKTGNLTGSALTGLGMAGITYSGLAVLNINLGSGNDSFTVASTSNTVNLNSGAGNDTVNIQTTGAPINLATGTGTNTVNVGGTGGALDGIQGAVTLVGSAQDILNVTDTGSAGPKSGNLTGVSLTGLGMAGITYSGVATLNISLGSGVNSFTIASTHAGTFTTLNSGTGSDTVTVLATSDITTINTQSGADTVLLQGTGALTTINAGAGNDTINVQAIGAATIINNPAGVTVINVGSLAPAASGIVDNLHGLLTVNGSGLDILNVDDTGSTGAKTGSLTNSTVSGLGLAGIAYAGLSALNISLGSGGNSFTITSTNPNTSTTLNSGTGSDTIVVTSTSGPTVVNTQSGDDTVTLASTGASTTVNLGAGNDIVNVQSTGALTTIHNAAGNSVINVGSLAPALGGNVDGIQGSLLLKGSGTDTVNIDDTGSVTGKTGALTSSNLTGLNMGPDGITYSGVATLNVSLGAHNNVFMVGSTNTGTNTTVNSGLGSDVVTVAATGGVTTVNTQSGNDTVTLQSTGAVTTVNAGDGLDTVNILGTGALTTVNLGAGNDVVNVHATGAVTAINNLAGVTTVNVGSLAPATHGIVDGIQGALTLTGSGQDILNVDDTGSSGNKTGALSSSTVTGLGMGAGGITYSGVSALNVSLGSGLNTFTVTSTHSATATTVNSGIGTDKVTVQASSGPLTINSQTGNDTVTLQGTGGPIVLNVSGGNDTVNVRGITAAAALNNTGSGVMTVNVGSLAPVSGGIVDGIQGALTVTGNGSDILNIDDTGSASGKTGNVTGTSVNGLGLGGGITYAGLSALNLSLGSGSDVLTVQSTAPGVTNSINLGSGDDVANIQAISGLTTVNTGAGANVINLGSLAPAASGLMRNMQAALIVQGSGNDTMNVDDTGNITPASATFVAGKITGLDMALAGVSYSGLKSLNVSLGSGGNTLNVQGVSAGTATTLNTGSGSDAISVDSSANNAAGSVKGVQSLLTINGQNGTNNLTFDDSADSAPAQVTLTDTKLGAAAGDNFFGANGSAAYSGITNLTVKGGTGGNTINVQSTNPATATTINSGGGNDTVNVTATAGVTNVNTGSGTNTVNAGVILDNIQGALSIAGNGADTLNIDDTGSAGPKSGNLTASVVSGLGMGSGGITYGGLASLNLSLGSGGNTFSIASTRNGTVTTLNSGSANDTVNVLTTSSISNINGQGGDDTINIQSTGAPANINTGSGTNTVNIGNAGKVDLIQGVVAITGSVTDTINVDDTASAGPKNDGQLTSSALTGLGMAGITYSPLAALNISLGSGGNAFTIASTNSLAITTLNSGSGSDKVKVVNTGGVTKINTQAGNDLVNVQNTGAATSINTGSDTNTVNVGSTAGNAGTSAGIVTGVQGALTVTGNTADTLNIDDTGSSAIKTGALSSAAVTGLAMGPSGITYSGVAFLNLNLGSGADIFNIGSTNSATITTVNSGAGNDTVNILATSGVTNVNTGAGANNVSVGTGIVDQIKGALTIIGGGSDTMTVDDTGSPGAKSGNLTNTVLSGLAMGASGITYSGLSTLNINLGSGGNNFTIASTLVSTATNLNSGAGSDVVNVQTTSGAAKVTTGNGANIINVGNGGIVDQIKGALTVVGNGGDTMNIADTSSAGVKSGSLSNLALTGLNMGASGIAYSGLSTLNILLGSGGNAFTIASTQAGTTTNLNSGSANDTVNVQATSSPVNIATGAGANVVNVGTAGGIVDNIQGALTIIGNGTDTANVNDSGSVAAKSGTLTSTTLKGLQMGSPGITYSGLASLNINLGSGGALFNVSSTNSATATTVNGGAGIDTVNVNNVNGVLGTLTLSGTGNDLLNIDDTASTVARTGNASASAVTGLSPAPINYSGVAALTISLGSGGNTFTLASPNAAATLNSGAGSDTITIASTSASTTINTQSGNDTVTVQNTGAVTAINLGAGNDTVNIQKIGAATTVNNAAGTTVINVGNAALNNIQGALTVAGSGLDTLNLDDSGSATAKTGTLTSSTITGLGLGMPITYSGLSALNIILGSGGNNFTLISTTATTATTLNSGAGSDIVNVQGTSGATRINTGGGLNTINVGSKAPASAGILNNIQGALTVSGNGSDTMNVDDTGSSGAKTGALTSSTITGFGMGPGITYSGLAFLNLNLGSGKNTLAINSVGPATTVNGGSNAGNTLSISLAAIFSGNLTVSGFPIISSITVNGNFAGTLTLGPGTNIQSMTVTGNFTGQLLSQGTVTLLSISGNSPGLISAATVGTVTVGQAIGPIALTVREGSLQRQIEVSSSVTVLGLYYQSQTVAIRIANGTPASVFDLTLAVYNVAGGTIVSHSSSGKFSLSLLYAVASGSNTTALGGLYNLVIEGDLLATISTGAKTYFGLAANAVGGAQLPKDNVGGIAIRDLGVENSINVKTLQALAFGEYQEEEGDIDPASTAGTEDAGDLLVSTAQITAANGTYRAAFGQNYSVAMFIGQSNGQFENSPLLFIDQSTDGTAVVAAVKVVSGIPPQVSTIVLNGDGGSIQTQLMIGQSITSTGPMGDLYLNQNNTALNVTAPSIFGNIDLDGPIAGIIQTTGRRIDPITGAITNVAADLGVSYSYATSHGTVVTATTITSEGAMTGQLISRGNLVSQVSLYSGMSGGVIAVQGNLGAQVGSSRVGGLTSTSLAGLGGQVIVLGNVVGDIWINGGLKSMRLAINGSDIGNLTINGGVDASSVIAVRGGIGNSSVGTYFSLDSLKGILAVEGTVNLSHSYTSTQALFNKTNMGSNAALDAVFTNGGISLALDLTANLDLQGLGLILTDLLALHVTAGNLTGPTP